MKTIDLTSLINEDLWYYGNPYVPYQTEQLAFIEKNGYNTSKHVLTSHTGTHLECAKHWSNDGEGVNEVSLDKIAGTAKVLHFETNGEAFFCITKEMMEEADAGRLEKGDICILSTGWDAMIKEERYTWESPFITPAAAQYLVERGVKAVALDTPMIGDPRDGMDFVPEGTELPDVVLLDAGIPYILALVNTRALPEKCFFVGAPLKLNGADGSPIRAFAIVEE
ncbi:MAG: cyclase family protein [Eubacteriales bacterium]|nr:cyclase family protein [Eubacteriales bacterium]